MKKTMTLFLVFSLLALAENLLAQEELKFKENFSLSIQSKIYSKFLSSSLERIHPFRTATSNDVYSRLFDFQKEQELEKSSPSLAFGYLKRLAERKRKSRRTGGAFGLIGGAICAGLGAAVYSSAEEKGGWEGFFEGIAGTGLMIIGGASAVAGALSLAIPSGAERELKEVLRIPDLAQREAASREALSSLAARGKKMRIFSCIVLSGFSAYSLFRKNADIVSSGIFGAFAVSSLIRKTPAERAFQNYQQARDQQKRWGFHFGIGPRGDVMVCLSLSY